MREESAQIILIAKQFLNRWFDNNMIVKNYSSLNVINIINFPIFRVALHETILF